ncbi:JAB domain-containing protein [Cohnella zeiphila]|uniref:DNA repair protein RadC n=1 Tax=Cohnella zeiphila TaxID=2761120 RepID=A0A7X0VV01_9BACL|nr:DNA repair protein RadC [Cohnella zeiphila]MBB6731406.1 DNA repair protein RadC [Cohnella zeiphila]
MENVQQHQVSLVRLQLIREEGFYSQPKVESPEEAQAVFRQLLTGETDREHLALLCLDTKHRPTAIQVVAVGTLDSLLVHPREVFKTAILANAASIICAHWHPSGDPEPSMADVKVTHRLMQAGELLGIKLLDHLILGAGDDYLSLKESGIMSSLATPEGTPPYNV